MAHFAQLNGENIVTRVIVVGNQDCLGPDGSESEEAGVSFCQSLFGSDTKWKQTSYNGSIRGKFASIGDFYDDSSDQFRSYDGIAS